MRTVKIKTPHIAGGTLGLFLWNMLLAYFACLLCRMEFVLENWGMYRDSLFQNSLSDLITGSLRFDTSALLYINSLYALLMLLPLHYKETRLWQQVAKWVFIVVNAVCIVLNLGDSVYVNYAGRRTTASVFQEFRNENNLTTVFGTELLNHWYLLLFGALLIWSLWRFYGEIKPRKISSYKRYYIKHTLAFLLFIPLCIAGMRGGFTTAVRPITISNANQYVNHPQEAAVILNTPFSIIRTIGKTAFKNPGYFTPQELNKIYSPVHKSLQTDIMKRRNVVVLIVESFGMEYINEGLAPEVSEIIKKSLTFRYSFSNGRKSIDGMPSILSSIPMFVEPFFLTPASMNTVSGIAGELKKEGYHTAFFHGAENGSMGFEAFARATGFGKYYGRTEYEQAHGTADFDGTWAIWDEPFLQFYAEEMNRMQQPFMTAVFTASSHHPFNIPDNYQPTPNTHHLTPNPIHKCIRYTDHAVGEFFRTAAKQPWFQNTIFVITNDHTNIPDADEYKTDLGVFRSPVIIYDPSGEIIQPGQRNCIAQQIDIMPTVLAALGYDRPYVAFGQNLLQTCDDDTWAVNYQNGIYQFVRGQYLLQFDGQQVKALYNYRQDSLLQHRLHNPSVEKTMQRQLKAIIQSYMQRMSEDKLTISNE